VYLDSTASPKQEGDDISILQVNLRKNFIFLKNFRLNNHIQFQSISNTTVVPLPAFSSFHSLFYENNFFENSLNFQLGADFAYIGEYGGYAYSPSLAQFYLRNENASELGRIMQLDIFLNLRIHKAARIFAKLENITGKPFSEDSYRIENYAVPGRVLKLGLSWRMLN
jgi:outer membrane receptor protein involved in Fe transport